MLILKYLKCAPAIQDEELLEPSSCLSNVVPLKEIEMANVYCLILVHKSISLHQTG